MNGYSDVGYAVQPGYINAAQGVNILLNGLEAGLASSFTPAPMPIFQGKGVPVRDYNNLVYAYNELLVNTNVNAKKLAAAWRIEKQRADRLASALSALKKKI